MLTRVRRLVPSLLTLAFAFAWLPSSRAELVWTPESGWVVQGGALAGVFGNDGRNALENMNKGRAAEERHSYFSALSHYKRVYKKYPSSVYASEAYFHVGGIRLVRHQYFKSFEAYQELISHYPNFDRFDYVIHQQYFIADKLINGARNRLFGFIPGFKNREKGIEFFERAILNAPYNELAPEALTKIAKGHRRLGNTEEAIDALDRLINTYPQSVLAPDAYLRLAETHASLVDGPYYDQASTHEAITYFEDYMILYPGDKGVGTAEQGLAKMKKTLAQSKIKMADFYYYKRDNYVAARILYNEAITSYPDSEIAAVARKRITEVDAKAELAKSRPPHRKFLGLL